MKTQQILGEVRCRREDIEGKREPETGKNTHGYTVRNHLIKTA